jgi:hypothetical protein
LQGKKPVKIGKSAALTDMGKIIDKRQHIIKNALRTNVSKILLLIVSLLCQAPITLPIFVAKHMGFGIKNNPCEGI